MDESQEPRDATDSGRQAPEDYVPGPAETLAALRLLVTGGKAVVDHRRAAALLHDPKAPLAISVLGSRTAAVGEHEIIVHVENHGVHGVYIEAMTLIEPNGAKLEVKRHPDPSSAWRPFGGSGMGLDSVGDETSEADGIPTFVPAGLTRHLRLVVHGFPIQRALDRPWGVVEYRYVVAGIGQKPPTARFDIAVRGT